MGKAMEDLLTVKEIAKRYGVTAKTIRRWINKVGQDLGQRLDKQGTFGYGEDEISLIAKAGGRKPIESQAVDAELVEDVGVLTLESGTGMRLNSSQIGNLDVSIDFDLGGASTGESQAMTKAADAELMNIAGLVGASLGEMVVREVFQKKEIMAANLAAGMVQGAHTALSSQGVVQKEAA